MNETEKWAFTIPQVADRLQVSRSLMWRRVLLGEVPSIRIGRARRITFATVQKLLGEAGGKKK